MSEELSERFMELHRVYHHARADWFREHPDAEWDTGADEAGLLAVADYVLDAERKRMRAVIDAEIERTYTLDRRDERERAYTDGKHRALLDISQKIAPRQ